jgi:hypothetical protein
MFVCAGIDDYGVKTISFLTVHQTEFLKRILLPAFLLVLAGGLIYVFFRPSPALFFSLFKPLGLESFIKSVRLFTLGLTPFLPEWVLYSLPQGLWALAYTMIIAGIWINKSAVIRHIWISTIPILVLGFELLQYAGLIDGTFCLQDILFGLGGMITGILLIHIMNRDFYGKTK